MDKAFASSPGSWCLRGPTLLLLCLAVLAGPSSIRAQPRDASATSVWWAATVEQALERAGSNRTEMVTALRGVPSGQREGLQFLMENMPQADLQALSAAFLLEHTALAYEAWEKAPWRDAISTELFLSEILAYANINETREAWRKPLRELCVPLVKDCRTPAEAGQRLNQQLFGLVKVKYSTKRKKANQSPSETMSTGLASCTGLSILLVDACRSVGVPARLVGIPNWVDNRGNHAWVEIWDQRWHFTGAAEQDPNGLDRGWFAHDASLAIKDSKEHAIYAASFKKTGLPFPMVWSRDQDYVSAVNVTDHYTVKAKPVEAGKTRLMVKVLERPGGSRVAARVRVLEPGAAAAALEGTSKDEKVDTNDLLSFEVARAGTFEIEVEHNGQKVRQAYHSGTNQQELVVVPLQSTPAPLAASQMCYFRPPVRDALAPAQETALREALQQFFMAAPAAQADWKFDPGLEKLLRENEPAARETTWETYRTAPIHTDLRRDYEARTVRFQSHVSPYTIKTVGRKPEGGWPLFIAMHGGGGAPKEVNDSQWKHMQIYYRDQPSVTGYLYVALRAPDDTWNGFYTDYTYPLIENLLRQFRLFAEVDPNKIFLMGYSHGGYGAFAIGPKMPDQFAAIHSSAAAPTDGEFDAKTLRNTVFTYMVGELDNAYGRLSRCRVVDEAIRKLRGDRTDIFPVTLEFKAGYPHSGLPDRDKIKDMYPAVRNPIPIELTWAMTDGVIRNFFWVQAPQPGKGQEIDAVCRDNRITVNTTKVTAASLLLDRRLVDFNRPVALEVNGRVLTRKVEPSLRTLGQTMAERADPDLAFSARLGLDL